MDALIELHKSLSSLQEVLKEKLIEEHRQLMQIKDVFVMQHNIIKQRKRTREEIKAEHEAEIERREAERLKIIGEI